MRNKYRYANSINKTSSISDFGLNPPGYYHEFNHVLRVYNTILGTMNDSVLFNIVREKHSLCYSIGSYYSKFNPSLTIYAGINKDNYEKESEEKIVPENTKFQVINGNREVA